MKFNIKNYLKLSIIYTLGAAFPPMLQLIVQPIMEGKHRLDQIDFSQLAISESITTLAYTIVLFSMGSTLARFYYDYLEDTKGRNRMIASAFNSMLMRGILLLSVAFIFSDFIGELFSQSALQNFSSYGYLCILVGINRAINLSAVTLYRNEERVAKFISINIISGILRAAFQLIGVFYYEMNFIGYLWGSLVGSSIVTIYILFDTYRSSGWAYDRKILRSLNKFSMPLFQYEILSWGLMFLDRFFLEKSPAALGIYDNAMKFAIGIQLVIQGLMSAVQPEVFRLMAEGIHEKIDDIKRISNLMMAQTQIIVAVAILPTMIFISLFYETDLRFSAGLVTIIFVRFIIRAQYTVFAIPVMFLKKTRMFFYINSVVLIINLTLNYLLIPKLEAYGAIISFMTAYIIQIALIYLVQNRLIKITWNLKKVLLYPLLMVISAIILEVIKNIFSLNFYTTSVAEIVIIFISLFILYKKEIFQFFQKYLRIFTQKSAI